MGAAERIGHIGKKVVAGATVAGLSIGGYIGVHLVRERANAGVHGAVVDLNERNGMLIDDVGGRPAFLNYFKSLQPQDLALNVSITTTDTMPSNLRSHWGQLTKPRQGHVSYEVPEEEFRGIDPQSSEVIRYFFKEFEELTGIKVHVTENDPSANIVIGGYSGEKDTIGFASFPQEIPEFAGLRHNQGFLMLSTEYLKNALEEGNVQAIQALVAHEFGHNLGLYHPHSDTRVQTTMNDAQQDAVSRMSYNDMTYPPVATTEIDAGYGPLDIHLIRGALRSVGIVPPPINADDTSYLLSELRLWQMENATTKSGGPLLDIPALSILDSGGRNELVGSDGDDLLVTESGYCGLLDRTNKTIFMARDGQPYCLVEGEFSLVRGGDGNDLILTANGTEQTVYTGTGSNQVALVSSDIGSKTIITPDRTALEEKTEEAAVVDADASSTTLDVTTPATQPASGTTTTTTEPPASEKSALPFFPSTTSTTTTTVPQNRAALAEVAKPSDTTLTLHYSLFERGDASVLVVGDDVVLQIHAFSGRLIGQVTLQGQQKGQGIDRLRVVDNSGKAISEQVIPAEWTAEQWQVFALNPAVIATNKLQDAEVQADYAETRQALAGDAGAWTKRDSEDDAHDAAETSPHHPLHGTQDSPATHFVTYLRKREEEQEQSPSASAGTRRVG